jgi:hypothetical protein
MVCSEVFVMRLFRLLFALALGLALTASAQAGDKGDKAKKAKKAKPITGVVTAVQTDDKKETGTITLKVAAKKTKGTAPASTEKTVKVTTATKFVRVSDKKGNQKTVAANFAAVAKDAQVTVTLKGDEATEVKILAAKKKATKTKK